MKPTGTFVLAALLLVSMLPPATAEPAVSSVCDEKTGAVLACATVALHWVRESCNGQTCTFEWRLVLALSAAGSVCAYGSATTGNSFALECFLGPAVRTSTVTKEYWQDAQEYVVEESGSFCVSASQLGPWTCAAIGPVPVVIPPESTQTSVPDPGMVQIRYPDPLCVNHVGCIDLP